MAAVRPPERDVMRRLSKPLVGLVLLLALSFAGAHPQLLFANVTTEPAEAPAGEELELTVLLSDSARQEVPGLEMEMRIFEPGVDSDELAEVGAGEGAELPLLTRVPLPDSGDSGIYAGTVPPLEAGSYPFRIVELVDGEVESNSSGVLPVGSGEPVDMELILPPVAAGVGTWLIWLVGLPLLAGVLVTILVLTGKGPKAEAE